MLSFDSVKLRLEREQSLSYMEFNYMILQAYDFLELNNKKNFLILSLLAFTSCVAVGPRCTYTQDGTKISSWIWFTKEIPIDLSKDNCN